jgi:hypothetical protein
MLDRVRRSEASRKAWRTRKRMVIARVSRQTEEKTSMKTGCPKCEGKGLLPREESEADSDLHPVLSRFGKLCDRCGGSGVAVLTAEEFDAQHGKG